MDESAKMLQKTDAKKLQSTDLQCDKLQTTYLQVANYLGTENTDLPKIPKRKLSVFYRSFDVITPMNQEKEKETIEFRRTSSSPSVRIEKSQDRAETKDEVYQQINHQKDFVNSCRALIENGITLNNSAGDSNANLISVSKVGLPKEFKLPRVREDTIIDTYATITENTIGKHFRLNCTGEDKFRGVDEKNVAVNFREKQASTESSNFYSLANATSIVEIRGIQKPNGSANVSDSASRNPQPALPNVPHAATCTDLVKIKDSEYPRSFASESSAGPRGKYASVGPRMSNHEDSSIGSDSEDDSIDRTVQEAPPKGEPPFNLPSIADIPKKPEFCNGEKAGNVLEPPVKQGKRHRSFAVRRSLSEGDSERYHRTKRRCKCIDDGGLFDEQERFKAFPSFTDNRLRASGLSNSEETLYYRENLPESELERKYIAFSIGLCTDRITLQRRVTLSLRHRDLAERNLTCEIQKMEMHIQDLLPLCTDGESIEKVERVRHQLDMVAQCARKVSSAAETLGAVYQERRISKAISIADKYLQILRTRCENLATEIAETKQFLLKNNIVIEDRSGEMGDDLVQIRYRNGFPSNNRTVIARRRASIATISRPLISQDTIKEGPRQRNSVSGRVAIRRPSFCSESQKWETEKLNRTDSSNSVCELCDISEQSESTRRNSVKDTNSSSTEQIKDIDTTNRDSTADIEDDDRLTDKRTFLDSTVTKTVEKQLKLCKITTEPLRIPIDLVTWPTVLWCTVIFFLGFFTKYITSSNV